MSDECFFLHKFTLKISKAAVTYYMRPHAHSNAANSSNYWRFKQKNSVKERHLVGKSLTKAGRLSRKLLLNSAWKGKIPIFVPALSRRLELRLNQPTQILVLRSAAIQGADLFYLFIFLPIFWRIIVTLKLMLWYGLVICDKHPVQPELQLLNI